VGGDLSALEDRLGVRLDDRGLLERALTHRSYAFENGGLENNERLEFLGDAVLGLVVTELIYEQMPDAPEGELAKLRAAAVREDALAEVARDLDLGPVVRLGKGEVASGGAGKESILADTLEAVLGAIHLDQGYAAAERAIRSLFRDRLEELAGVGPGLDYKTSLQELVTARYESLPTYELSDTGPDHEKVFTAEVYVEGELVGTGSGGSKKKAEQAAAQEAYLRLSDGGATKETRRAGTP
jgi:ribonuclease III